TVSATNSVTWEEPPRSRPPRKARRPSARAIPGRRGAAHPRGGSGRQTAPATCRTHPLVPSARRRTGRAPWAVSPGPAAVSEPDGRDAPHSYLTRHEKNPTHSLEILFLSRLP